MSNLKCEFYLKLIIVKKPFTTCNIVLYNIKTVKICPQCKSMQNILIIYINFPMITAAFLIDGSDESLI